MVTGTKGKLICVGLVLLPNLERLPSCISERLLMRLFLGEHYFLKSTAYSVPTACLSFTGAALGTTEIWDFSFIF